MKKRIKVPCYFVYICTDNDRYLTAVKTIGNDKNVCVRDGKEIAVLTKNNSYEIKDFVKKVNDLNQEQKLFRIKNNTKYDKRCKDFLVVKDKVVEQLHCKPVC